MRWKPTFYCLLLFLVYGSFQGLELSSSRALIYASYEVVQQFAYLLICAAFFNFPKFLQENSRLENELLENAEKLAEYESLTNKLQRNLENVLAEKVNLYKI
jgi:hypothetical protein